MSITLQRFTSENIPQVCDYIESIREFDEIVQVIPKDRQICEEKLRGLLDGLEAIGVVLFDDEKERVVGIGIAALVEMWWTSEKTWNNILFYIDPAYRRSKASSVLMDFFKGVTDTSGVPLYFDVIAGPNTQFDVYDRIFKFKGLKRIGTSFFYEPKAKAA